MIEDYLIAVCGLGRCGTTAVMAMLHAAGIKIHCDWDKVGNSWESSDMVKLPDDHAWIDSMDPQAAFKLLDPHRTSLPKSRDMRIIMLTRDNCEQAKSQLTFLRTVGHHTGTTRRALQAHIRKEERAAVEAIRQWPRRVHCSFEMLIRNPPYVALQIARLLALNVEQQRKMSAVIWDRDPNHSGRMQEIDRLAKNSRLG